MGGLPFADARDVRNRPPSDDVYIGRRVEARSLVSRRHCCVAGTTDVADADDRKEGREGQGATAEEGGHAYIPPGRVSVM